MGFNQKEIDNAIEFSKTRTFKAEVKHQDIQFIRIPADIPDHIREKVAEVLEDCADYFERTIFMGEYEPRKEDPPFPKFDNTLDEINHHLDYFQEEYVFEVKKAVEAEKITHSLFAQTMLRHKKMMNQDKIKRLKKEQEENRAE
jgi:hypothetical protein